MIWVQKQIQLSSKRRGCYLIHDEVFSQIKLDEINIGLCQIFIQHTSASLALNENADPAVRTDLEAFLNQFCSDDTPYFNHTMEGKDDMPAHIKNIMIGYQATIPIKDGQLALGTWQGLYLCEHRDRAEKRTLMVTAFGQPFLS
tara:strand:+ start:24 stop:455 length:432 start_codon:yes stop_codon:yes gene_type:complete